MCNVRLCRAECTSGAMRSRTIKGRVSISIFIRSPVILAFSLPPSAKDAAEQYPIAFADVCVNALQAASKYIPVENPLTLYIALTMRAAPQSGLSVLTGEMCGMSSLTCSRSL